MGWQVWADSYDASSLSDKSLYQPFRPNQNILIKALRTWFVIYNDPIFTSLNARIYATDSGEDRTPTKLIATSDSRTKAQIHTEDYGIRETWFEWSPVVELEADTWYAIVINGVGYNPTLSSYLSWMKAYPDPVLPTDYTNNLITVHRAPYQIYFIGASY